MARSANSFKRGGAKFKPQSTVLVLCEDSKSSKRYLHDAAFHFRVHLEIDIAHCGRTDPKGIVEAAIARSKHYDKVFCVIDRDTHPSFDEAVELAQPFTSLSLIPSYPCFEFWYLLHFGFKRAPYVAAGNRSCGEMLIADLRTCEGMQNYSKGADNGIFAQLLPQFSAARQTSARVLAHSIDDEEPNPSTHVHLLMDVMEGMSAPTPLQK